MARRVAEPLHHGGTERDEQVEKKGKKLRHPHQGSLAKAETKILERSVAKSHPENQWNKDRYSQGSKSEEAGFKNRKGSEGDRVSRQGAFRDPGAWKQTPK